MVGSTHSVSYADQRIRLLLANEKKGRIGYDEYKEKYKNNMELTFGKDEDTENKNFRKELDKDRKRRLAEATKTDKAKRKRHRDSSHSKKGRKTKKHQSSRDKDRRKRSKRDKDKKRKRGKKRDKVCARCPSFGECPLCLDDIVCITLYCVTGQIPTTSQ